MALFRRPTVRYFAAASAASGPVRRAAAQAAGSMRQSFAAGARSSFAATGGSSNAGTVGGNPPSASTQAGGGSSDSGPPGWAQRMKRNQSMVHGAQTAAHVLKSGDSHGGGHSVDLSRALRNQQVLASRAVEDGLRHLGGDLAWKVGPDAGDERCRDHGSRLHDIGRSLGFETVGADRSLIRRCVEEGPSRCGRPTPGRRADRGLWFGCPPNELRRIGSRLAGRQAEHMSISHKIAMHGGGQRLLVGLSEQAADARCFGLLSQSLRRGPAPRQTPPLRRPSPILQMKSFSSRSKALDRNWRGCSP